MTRRGFALAFVLGGAALAAATVAFAFAGTDALIKRSGRL